MHFYHGRAGGWGYYESQSQSRSSLTRRDVSKGDDITRKDAVLKLGSLFFPAVHRPGSAYPVSVVLWVGE